MNEKCVNEICVENVYELLEQNIQKKPENIALVYDEQTLTYQELGELIDKIAINLTSKNQVIGLMLDRSIEMVAAVWAVIKSGNAYLPIDMSLPQNRINFMLEDCQVQSIIANDSHKGAAPQDLNVISIEQCAQSEQVQGRQSDCSASNLAYIMYTSGSTGMPKGVQIAHDSLLNYVECMQKYYPLGDGERVMLKTPYSFDVSIRELIYTLAFGGTLIVAQPHGHKDPVYISQLIERHDVNVVHFVPSMLEIYLNHPDTKFTDTVSCVICSGEPILRHQIEGFYQQLPKSVPLLNMYGPTEATVEVSIYNCAELNEQKLVPIGIELPNIELAVLDDDMNPCNIDQPGSLYIGGRSLARGYVNRPELTASSFKEFQIPGKTCTRWYSTGDLAVLDGEGLFTVIGRNDEQISIRGYRIELDEIQSQIVKLPEVQSAVVIVTEPKKGQPKIASYVCPAQAMDENLLIQKVLKHLRDSLPEYMVPSYVMVIDEIPLSSNGKVDKKSLPVPTIQFYSEYRQPKNEMEEKIQQLWQQHLDLTDLISVDFNYYQLGGDSTIMIQMVKGINDTFGLKLLFQQLIEHETIEQQADFISKQLQQLEQQQASVKIDQDEMGTFEI